MRHLVSGRKLNRTASHRRAMLANLATSILEKERVTTTLVKAKEVRGVVERLITYGKKSNLSAIRLAARTVRCKTVLKKLFDDIAPSFNEREGGYTRILKLKERKGDNAELAIIELVGRNGDDQRKRKKKSKKVEKRIKTKEKKETLETAHSEKMDEKNTKESNAVEVEEENVADESNNIEEIPQTNDIDQKKE